MRWICRSAVHFWTFLSLAKTREVGAALRLRRLLALVDRDEALALLVAERLIEPVERGTHDLDRFEHRIHAQRIAASRPVGVLGSSVGQAFCMMSTALTDAAFSASSRSCCF